LKTQPNRGALVAAVHRREDFPKDGLPAVALAGRSNVGKSSLLNRLLGRQVARVGKTPGKTRGIYFYATSDGYHFADLPGAGYARRSREEREGWARLADELFGSGRVILTLRLIDSRVTDSAADVEIRDFLERAEIPSLAVATKWDRLGAAERVQKRRSIEAAHGAVWPVSAKTGEGIEGLKREIRRAISRGEERAHG
jgi:GTP-binding protein